MVSKMIPSFALRFKSTLYSYLASEPPVFSAKLPPRIFQDIGEDVQLKCSGRSKVPGSVVSVKWLNGSTPLVESKKFIIQSEKLVITKVTTADGLNSIRCELSQTNSMLKSTSEPIEIRVVGESLELEFVCIQLTSFL